MSENEDKYHDTILDLEARAKKNEDVVLKIGNSLQGMFMLEPKLMSFYDSNVKHGLGSIDLDALRSRMYQLKGQGSCNSHNQYLNGSDAATNTGMQLRQSFRVLLNTNFFVEGVKDMGGSNNNSYNALHVEGDNHGVSLFVGRLASMPSSAQPATEAAVSIGSQTTPGKSTLISTMNPSLGMNSNDEGGIWSTRVFDLRNSKNINVEETYGLMLFQLVHSHLLLNFLIILRLNLMLSRMVQVILISPCLIVILSLFFGKEGITPTGWTSPTTGPNDLISDTPIVNSVDINTPLNSNVRAVGACTSEQPKIVEKVSVRFENTLYGYFIDTLTGLESVLEEGPWIVRNSPTILKKWSVGTSLLKEELTRIPVWVKFHDVPIQVFEEDGLSFMMFLSKCLKRMALTKLLDNVTIGIPSLVGDDFLKETIRVDYEWKPPRCDTCEIFGHTSDCYPKNVMPTLVVNENNNANTSNDSFQQVVNKRRDHKKNTMGKKIPKGVPVTNGFHVGKEFNYKPKVLRLLKRILHMINLKDKDVVDTGAMKHSNISSLNPFASLAEEEDEVEDIENVYDESTNLNLNHTLGASTPANIDKYYVDRLALWNNLAAHTGLMRDKPWVLLGDFNAALNLEDHSCGGYKPSIAMREFKECVLNMQVIDVNCTGLHFTWIQKPKGPNGVPKKIDRITRNLQF
uniref:Zinc knuckle CX2CX4HX4C n=1 Tax=Tanacetum cinerariifolium TaxID=118510 RepID=A0A6L2M688_TANCI|nr:zinc knuckle CX2CX4HX4C [Tanacetum cinerariifolium]